MKRYLLLTAFLSFAYGAFAVLTVGISENSPAICTYPSGSLSANIDGGVPPYSYLWNTGETTSTLENLTAGLYSVTVTDDLGTQATASHTLAANNPEGYVGGFQACPDGVLNFPFRMLGQGNLSQVGMMPITFQNGNFMADLVSSGQPYENALYLGDVTDNWPAPGTVLDLPFTDASGCPGVIHAEVPAPFAYPVPQVLAVDGACSGGSNGGVLVHVPVAQHPWPNYIDLLHDGMPFGQLEFQANPEQSFGKVPHTVQRNDLPAGEYAMVVWTRFPSPYEWLEQQFYPDGSYCGDTTWFTVPDLGYTCGTVSGMAFMDDNFNCTPQYNEVTVPAAVMEIQPGGYFTLTNASGAYHQNVPYGSYTVQQQSTAVSEHCAGVPQAFSLSAGMLTATHNFPDTTLLSRDVEIDLSSSYARPGFQMSYVARVEHLTAGATGAMTITLDFDPLLSFVSGTPTPTSVVGNTVTWNVTQLTSFGIRSVGAYFQVPPDVTLIGTSLSATATVGISQPEQNIANNTDTETRTITGAYDPNAKEVRTSSGLSSDLYYLDQDTLLNYTIQFQNTGNDTAFFVVITDTLPETLDPATFNMGASSHSCMVEMVEHGVLRFFFPNILLPDSNVNEPLSHGFVSFRIQPRLPLVAGTQIENIANIYFDYNPPVITEPSVLTAEFSTGMQVLGSGQGLTLMPNPTDGPLTIVLEDETFSGAWMRLMASDGRVVMVDRMTSTRMDLDLSKIAPGLYTIAITSTQGRSVVSRVALH